MKLVKPLTFFRKVKVIGKNSCIALALCGMINLFFLPFIHFHPDNTHAHPGHFEIHKHQGHFHSEALEYIAHWANIHPLTPEEDKPLHHSHSSPDHDADQVEYTTLALHTFDKTKHFSKTDLVYSKTTFHQKLKETPLNIHPVFFAAPSRPNPVRQIRGPPSA